MATSKSHNSGTVKDTCKIFAANWVFGVGQSNGIIQISVRPALLPWQQADVIWTQNRPLLSFYKRYHQDSCTK